MPFTTITKPDQGDTTKKSLIDTIIDDLADLNSRISAASTVLNGSFETDSDSDGIPDAWTRTLFTGGTFLLDNTDQTDGLYSVKFTSPGGGGNGGGYIESTDAFPVSPIRQIEVLWSQKSSAATVSNIVQVYWFKSDLTASATPSTTIYTNAATNPTNWTVESGIATPPSDARFAKVRLTGCSTASTVAGTTRFDDVRVRIRQAIIPTMELLTASSTWVCPLGVSRVRVKAWGGGAGGGNGAGAGGGGGGGGYVEGCLDVTPGNSYVYTVGTGGASGVAGNDTTFSTITANGGGATGGTAGGTGGGGSGGTRIVQGESGESQTSSPEARGGASCGGGFGGTLNTNGQTPGGGGGGKASAGGGAGADGRIVLEY